MCGRQGCRECTSRTAKISSSSEAEAAEGHQPFLLLLLVFGKFSPQLFCIYSLWWSLSLLQTSKKEMLPRTLYFPHIPAKTNPNLTGSHNSFGEGKLRRKPLQSSNPATVKLCETEVTILSWLVVWHGCRDDWKGLWIVFSWVTCALYNVGRGDTLCCRTCTARFSPGTQANNPLSNTALISATYYEMRRYQCRNFLQLLHTHHHMTWMLPIIKLCTRLI